MVTASGANKGFTMIEVMVVVAIIAILASVALPSFSGTLERQRVRSTVETFVSDLRLARSTAEAQGARGSSVFELTVDSGDPSVWSYTVINDLNGSWLVALRDFSGDVEVAVADFGDADGDGNTDILFTSERALILMVM